MGGMSLHLQNGKGLRMDWGWTAARGWPPSVARRAREVGCRGAYRVATGGVFTWHPLPWETSRFWSTIGTEAPWLKTDEKNICRVVNWAISIGACSYERETRTWTLCWCFLTMRMKRLMNCVFFKDDRFFNSLYILECGLVWRRHDPFWSNNQKAWR
jgi:hypothetical protein